MKNSIIGKLQLLISAAAVVIIALLSFTPMLTVTLESNLKIYENSLDRVINTAFEKKSEEIEKDESLSPEEKKEAMDVLTENYMEIIYEIVGMNEKGEEGFDTELSLSAVEIAKSSPDLAKLAQYWVKALQIDTAYEMANDSDAPDEEAEKRCKELQEELYEQIDPDAINLSSIRVFRLFLNGFLSSVDLADMEEETAFRIATLIVLIAFKFAILFSVAVLFPLSMAFSLVGLAFSLLSGKRYNKILKKCKKTIIRLAMLLLAVVVCGAELSTTGTLILLAAAAAIVINLLASRVKSYTEHERRFLNVMQLSAIISTVGIAIFAFFLAEADLLSFYTSAKLTEQVAESQETTEEVMKALGILAGMGALTIVVLQRVFRGAVKLVTRAACMGGGGGNGFGTAVAGILLIAINHYVLDMFDISLGASQKDALGTALIGIIIALAGAVVFKVLGVVFAHGTTIEEKRAVMTGTSINDKKDD